MNVRSIAGTAMIAAALTAAGLGAGAGTAAARPGPHVPGPPVPPIPRIDDPTGWNPAPGQIKKFCPIETPPGHWIGGPHGIPCT